MARKVGDSPWDVLAMFNYNTITSLAESPVQQDLIYAGTDDGILQVTEDGGQNWKKIEVGFMPGVLSTAFINDIKADLYDANTVYVTLDNHKYGDYSPYLVKSTDKGNTWSSIRSNLPDRTLLWRLVQDHVKKELCVLSHGMGVSILLLLMQELIGQNLREACLLSLFRDLAIQKRENDLVGASFGRGFYILDDYSALREISAEQLEQEATLFNPRKAWWYIPRGHVDLDTEKGSMGAQHYVAKP